MRYSFHIALAALAIAAATGSAKADPYRWCAIFSDDLGGVTSCYFDTLDQCRATVSGIGGQCIPNPSHSAPPDRRRSRR